MFPSSESNTEQVLEPVEEKNRKEVRMKVGRGLLDTYADSLRYVNKMYNGRFGSRGRKVPAHMAHLVQIDIIHRLHGSFPDEFESTSSHKIRSSNDMQFAFSYFYFLMNEVHSTNISQVVNGFDTDRSGLVIDSV